MLLKMGKWWSLKLVRDNKQTGAMQRKKTTKPLVSFVIRTKNEDKFLEKVLRSLYSQSYTNIEIVVVDSGSTDETIKINKKYAGTRVGRN